MDAQNQQDCLSLGSNATLNPAKLADKAAIRQLLVASAKILGAEEDLKIRVHGVRGDKKRYSGNPYIVGRFSTDAVSVLVEAVPELRLLKFRAFVARRDELQEEVLTEYFYSVFG